MKKTLLASVALMALAVPAHAQDKYGRTFEAQPQAAAPVRTAPVATTTTTTRDTTTYNDTSSNTFGGPYIGAYGGYGWTDADTAGTSADINGADYGGLVGYKINNVMNNSMGLSAALEGYYGGSSADDTIAGVSVEKNREWGINVRPGITLSNGLNPYAIVGYRNTEFEAAGNDEDYNGFDAGVGMELMSWGNTGLRADYTHTWYDEDNGLDLDEDDLRVAVTYHFQ